MVTAKLGNPLNKNVPSRPPFLRHLRNVVAHDIASSPSKLEGGLLRGRDRRRVHLGLQREV